MKTKPLLHAAVFFSLFILLHSCGNRKEIWQVTIEDVEGVTVVKNPLKPKNTELQIKFEEDLTIGVEDGDENYMFGSRVLLNSDNEGNIFVTDKDRNTIKKFDSSGRFLQSIGRPGQGPGEFQDISEVRFDIEGNIFLNDKIGQRLSFLSKDGQYIKSVSPLMFFEEVLINNKGHYIAKSADNVELKSSKKWDFFYGLFDENFNLKQEFLRLPQKSGKLSKGSPPAQVMADWLSGVAFQPIVSYTMDKNGKLFFGYSKDYKIKVYSPDGMLVKIIQREFIPMEVSGRDKNLFRQFQSEQLRNKIPEGEEEKIFELAQYPKYKPAYERFTLMENGWIFVIVDSTQPNSVLVDIINQDGEYLAQFKTDIPIDRLSFNNGKAYAVATVNDYQFVKRYDFKILEHGSD